ncbi:MAG TPA: ABC transporter permease, partial [Puia sp.]
MIGFLAGVYPSLLLSSFSPIESLKGKLNLGNQGAFFRKSLVVFQFVISVLLIISITIISTQMNYVRNTDLGFNKEQTMLVRIDNNDIGKTRVLFKNSVQNDPPVMSVSLMSGEPGGFHDMYMFQSESKPDQKILLNTEFADFEFVQTLGIKMLAGRDLSASFPTDSAHSALINHTAATFLGYTPEQAVGKWIK